MTTAGTLPRIADGATRILGIVGDPVVQVRAPAVWSALFRANGINAICVPMHYSGADLAPALQSLSALQNLVGLIITIPHKPAAVSLVSEPTHRARLVGAVNIMRRKPGGGWLGDIADGAGFAAALKANGKDVSGKRTLVVGAGGVGTAIAFALAEAGASSIAVSDIDDARAQSLADRLTRAGIVATVGAPRAVGYEVVVNATPIGMRPDDPLPIDPAGMRPDTIVGEVIMSPPVTQWVATAREMGCFAQPGSDLMDYEIAEMAEFFGFATGDWSPEAITRVLEQG